MQLPGKPFQELLAELRLHLKQLDRGAGATTQDAPDPSLALDVRTRVQSVLAARRDPVVIVLDTLEVAMTGETERLRPLLELLGWLHDQVPAVRLVLAGRYDVLERVGDAPAALATGLSLEAARVRARRGARLPDAAAADPRCRRCVEAAVATARGVPFKLALIGDVIDQRPDLTAAEIRGYDDADLLYLTERVIERIENPQVRWLLRYGVIPRQLRRDFVERVMLGHLERVMRGRERGRPPRGRRAARQQRAARPVPPGRPGRSTSRRCGPTSSATRARRRG